MKENKFTLKETFTVALENYKKKKFLAAESLCKKILIIISTHEFIFLSATKLIVSETEI